MNWDEIADSYLALSEDRDKILRPALLEHIRANDVRSIADVGGGDGRFLDLICKHYGPEHFSRLALTDSSSRMRQRAAERMCRAAPVEVVSEPSELPLGQWQLVLFIAVWMSLEREEDCISLLRAIRSLLAPGGRLIAAVTHPCFRCRPFHSYSTSFDMRDYFKSGKQFRVNLYDSVRSLAIWDTHWSLTDHARQLNSSGFLIESLRELPDVDDASEGAPWLMITAKPVF
jgi:trans-aconitate methyltransferase